MGLNKQTIKGELDSFGCGQIRLAVIYLEKARPGRDASLRRLKMGQVAAIQIAGVPDKEGGVERPLSRLSGISAS